MISFFGKPFRRCPYVKHRAHRSSIPARPTGTAKPDRASCFRYPDYYYFRAALGRKSERTMQSIPIRRHRKFAIKLMLAASQMEPEFVERLVLQPAHLASPVLPG
ncbi:MAG: hypothetical protein A2W31_03800 [Planctomycetes bacterium RBG_16_64_10]|nr:MAG: hypothetical protein A2W31_03800 [Planctomycetes bacterium RBG_16_64_10]